MNPLKNPQTVVAIVSLYLFIYTLCSALNLPIEIISTLFFFAPMLVLGMVYSVLKYGTPSRELREGEEFGYSDMEEEN